MLIRKESFACKSEKRTYYRYIEYGVIIFLRAYGLGFAKTALSLMTNIHCYF